MFVMSPQNESTSRKDCHSTFFAEWQSSLEMSEKCSLCRRKMRVPQGKIAIQLFFPDVVGIGTGDPVFGSPPAHLEPFERETVGRAAPLVLRPAHFLAHVSRRAQRPPAGLL